MLFCGWCFATRKVATSAVGGHGLSYEELADELREHKWAKFALVGERLKALPKGHIEELCF